MDDAPDNGLDALSAAILQALASVPPGASMSLPRLGKRLDVGVSMLMRRLALMGPARIGGVEGPGWVRMAQLDDRWAATLTEAGRLFCTSSWPAGGEPD